MASIQEPEVQFAQRLASNEKPIRTKAIKKLRKYINVRSQKATDGFTGDELLKLWKGLFYCLWMQDKPLLQEELSKQISTLIHSFHGIDGQLLYLESFLQTFKREWTGIDRLRMDKFFQLVRFMFRQTFELIKRKNWDSSVVGRFLELLTAQLLQSGSSAPIGLQFHILDLYLTELAAVGSAELTAEQNLVFIEPFCKTAAKTKDRILFRAICSSIFSTIIDQAPFAIEDLMKELKAHEDSDSDSDSGQASEEDDEDQVKEKKTKALRKKGKQVNGCNSEEDNEDDDEDEDFGHLEDSDTELPRDDDLGPVLQFDYAALADKLFVLASRSSTPSHNRQQLYKIIKVLRDLSEGIFPQDEYPEEVSTDEDDDMFGSRKRMKRVAAHTQEEEEGAPAAKKSKGKKREANTLSKQNNGKDDSEQADVRTNNEKKKKKKKKKKAGAAVEEDAQKSEQRQIAAEAQSTVSETEGHVACSQAQSSMSSVKVTEAATPQGQPQTLLHLEVKKQASVTVTEDTTTDNKTQSYSLKKKKRGTPEVTETEQQLSMTTEPEVRADVSVSVKKKKRKSLKAESQTDAEAPISTVSCEASREQPTPRTTAKKKKKALKAERKPGTSAGASQANGLSSEDDVTSVHCDDSAEGGTTTTDAGASAKKKNKKRSLKADQAHEVVVEGKLPTAEITSEASQHPTTVPLNEKTKKKGKQQEKLDQQASEDMTHEAAADESSVTPPKKKKKKTNQKDSKITVREEGAAVGTAQLFKVTMTTPAKKKKKSNEIIDGTQMQVGGSVDGGLPQDELDRVTSSRKPLKKIRKIPIVFEYEADELEAAAWEAAEKETDAKKIQVANDVGESSTPLSMKKSQKKTKSVSGSTTDFITFQSSSTVPTPLFCKTKGGPSTPLSSKKKSQTPKSESKKVTFGLKNNKTAEFRKTDQSLLVSPDGSSRVPFDPKQKPKFGVLKSPPTPFPKKKTSSKTPNRRPSAADFF